MVAEFTTYRAVLCARCNEPIPISPKVGSLQDEIEHKETHAPRAFVLRCLLCEYESVYALNDVKRFEGEARRRTPKARAAFASGR
jgi:hypothetical protein